jgi:hypothetical protein
MTNKKTKQPRESSGFGKLTIWLLAGITLVAGNTLLSQQPARAADVVVYERALPVDAAKGGLAI